MKIYKRNPLDLDLGGLEDYLLPALGVLVILLVLFLLMGNGNNSVLSAQLMKNPLSLSANDSTILQVHVTNPTGEMAQNVVVQVTAPSAPQLSISPKSQTIPLLGSNESRTLDFLILPVDAASNPFTPGSYQIQVKTQMNGTPYQTGLQINIVK